MAGLKPLTPLGLSTPTARELPLDPAPPRAMGCAIITNKGKFVLTVQVQEDTSIGVPATMRRRLLSEIRRSEGVGEMRSKSGTAILSVPPFVGCYTFSQYAFLIHKTHS